MPENRGATHHRERIAEGLRDQIGIILEGELSDPRIGLCTVTEVIMAPGGKAARVLINVIGDETEARNTMEGLAAARAFIRTEVRSQLGVRHVPELTFHLDRSQEFSGRINELLDRVQKRKKR